MPLMSEANVVNFTQSLKTNKENIVQQEVEIISWQLKHDIYCFPTLCLTTFQGRESRTWTCWLISEKIQAFVSFFPFRLWRVFILMIFHPLSATSFTHKRLLCSRFSYNLTGFLSTKCLWCYYVFGLLFLAQLSQKIVHHRLFFCIISFSLMRVSFLVCFFFWENLEKNSFILWNLGKKRACSCAVNNSWKGRDCVSIYFWFAALLFGAWALSIFVAGVSSVKSGFFTSMPLEVSHSAKPGHSEKRKCKLSKEFSVLKL